MSFSCRGGLLATGFLLLCVGVPLGAHAAAASAIPAFAPDTARIIEAVDNSRLVTVQGSRPLRTLTATDAGVLPDSKPIRNMSLVLKRSADKQGRFDAYVNQLHNPASPNYHKWLTAKQVGSMFGPAQSDVDQVTTWLSSQGLTVNRVYPSGTMISFSGTPSVVSRAFHTQMHSFKTNGESHFANVSEQQIPAALAPVVKGVASLDNFFPKPQYRNVGVVSKDKQSGKWKQVSTSPGFTVPPGGLPQDAQTAYDVVPADFNKIYNVEPLWAKPTPIRGAGQTVAVLERTDVQPADIATFRSAFLPADAQGVVSYVNPPSELASPPVDVPGIQDDTTCSDPGLNGDEPEAALDAEWIGAAAPDANILFASCDDSNSPEFGPFTAAINLLNSPDGTPPPPVFSLSYGECEVFSTTDVVGSVGDLWELAASEGVTVFVASGDAGSAGCDQNQSAASFGINVNAMSSTPWNVSVGGTDFDDFGKQSNYWTSTNLPGGLSAIGYIPEQTWNDSCASSKLDAVLKLSDGVTACNTAAGQEFMNTAGGSGGPSILWTQPSWQTGIYGVPTNATRVQPDLALFAANGLYGHALVYCMSDPNAGGTTCDYSNPDNVLYNSAGGTSFAAPAMAGIQALINQATGQSNGLITPALYDFASKEYGTNESPNLASLNACNSSSGAAIGSTCVFNDVTQGDNNEPCYAGTSDCYSGALGNHFGVVSHGGDVTLAPAWQTNVGYDYATGLGSINAANLVNAMVKYNQAAKRGYAAPGDYLSSYFPGTDGHSDIAVVDPVQGIFTDIAMKGSIAVRTGTQTIAKGYTIGALSFFYPHIDNPGGTESSLALTAFNLASLAWTGPDNQLYVWLSDGDGGKTGYLRHAVGSPYPAGWTLVGAGDFNGPDGTGVTRSDLLWRNDSTGQIGWWQLNVGLDFRQHAAEINFSNNVSPIMSAASGYVPTIVDVNGDGYADIVWTNPNNNSVYVWINNQAGDFVRHQIADHPPGFTLYGAGDINGDGKTDLIWTNPTTNQMSWWIMNGFNVVDQQTRSVAPGYTMSSIADYDGDGLADILWVGPAGDVYEWQSNGSGFQSFRVTDTTGAPIVIPAGAKVQPIRLQGTAASGGVAPPAQ
ncbi:protease pro-enzyme activation domain-containing protein [Rhodanobacter sp. MP7CTX1]|uniref:protease pro-enzyme activation domain-containing protein n=1 Tax=Rhodanobacter sp. MP7CTX1 TaxID=2723084 RepID=UPI001606F5FD|nr:protease pro-enzyme activation domain-containing protein [Rhodanobacter sp. MP7CTX1]MBB6187586.1 hypothetical protein [Rhodanobacter sp. MP7CTX1]